MFFAFASKNYNSFKKFTKKLENFKNTNTNFIIFLSFKLLGSSFIFLFKYGRILLRKKIIEIGRDGVLETSP